MKHPRRKPKCPFRLLHDQTDQLLTPSASYEARIPFAQAERARRAVLLYAKRRSIPIKTRLDNINWKYTQLTVTRKPTP